MTTFGQEPTAWFQFTEPPGWETRGVERGARAVAMRWTSANGSTPPRPMPSSREESGIDFVRRAIQRSYQ